MEPSGILAGRARPTPGKLERGSSRTLMALCAGVLLVLYGAYGVALYALFSMVF
jgi:hypothetical protein